MTSLGDIRRSLASKLAAGRRAQEELHRERVNRMRLENRLQQSESIAASPLIKHYTEAMIDEFARTIAVKALEAALLERTVMPETGNFLLHLRIPETHLQRMVHRHQMESFNG